jgi:hypothetical protein
MQKTTTGAVVLDTLIPTPLADALRARLAANQLAHTGPQSMVDLMTEAAESYEKARVQFDTLGYTHPPAEFPDIVDAAMAAYLP